MTANGPGTAKTAFIFPGHCVSVGMGRSEPWQNPAVERLYSYAGELLGYDIKALMLAGPLERLRQTSCAQPAVFLASLSVFLELEYLGAAADLVAGRSLGDLTAVVAAGGLSPEEGLRLIKTRGEIFERACAASPGRMSVLLGLPEDTVRRICAQAACDSGEVCAVAGVNTAENFVISGGAAALAAADRAARAAGGHVMEIHMPGAFHSPLMRGAELEFSEVLAKADFREPRLPVADDRSPGGFVAGRAGLRKFLTAQISTGVDWRRRSEILRGAGVCVLCELGPSQGMARIASGAIPGSSYYEISSSSAARAFFRERAA
ncbi:MAG: ACP S-malonyltransferase [Elusimicrobiales bacterium]|nr:ACP S-malonyltransferase [Elusimicrobiales bacterium]